MAEIDHRCAITLATADDPEQLAVRVTVEVVYFCVDDLRPPRGSSDSVLKLFDDPLECLVAGPSVHIGGGQRFCILAFYEPIDTLCQGRPVRKVAVQLAEDLTSLFRDKIQALSGDAGTVLKVLVGQAAHDSGLAEIVEGLIFDVSRSQLTSIFQRAARRGEIQHGYNADLAITVAIGLVTTPLLCRAAGPAEVGNLVPEQLAATVTTQLSRPAASR